MAPAKEDTIPVAAAAVMQPGAQRMDRGENDEAEDDEIVPTLVLPVQPQSMQRTASQDEEDDCMPIIHATITKPTVDTKTGLTLGHDRKGFVIVIFVHGQNLWGQQTDLRRGMRVLEINGVAMERRFPIKRAHALIKEAEGVVTILARPRRAASNDSFRYVPSERNTTVTATVTKPTKDTSVGLVMAMNAEGYMMVTMVPRNGLFATQTEIKKGMQILSINGVEMERHTPYSQANAIIKEAEGEVTIVARMPFTPPEQSTQTRSEGANNNNNSDGNQQPTSHAEPGGGGGRERGCDDNSDSNNNRKRNAADSDECCACCCDCGPYCHFYNNYTTQQSCGEACAHCCYPCCDGNPRNDCCCCDNDNDGCCLDGCLFCGCCCDNNSNDGCCDGICCESGCSALGDCCKDANCDCDCGDCFQSGCEFFFGCGEVLGQCCCGLLGGLAGLSSV